MKRFLVTIVTFLVLVASVSAFEWKKVKTEVVADHDYYEWILDMSNQTLVEYPNEETKLVMSVSEWISDQIVIEMYVADYSKEIKEAEAKEYAKSVLARMFTATLYGAAGAVQAADSVYKSYGY